MSNTKMLIDATHPEETRVVVQRNGRVEEFDFESAARKLLRGNIYLAKVTRVEPSLQAAFVDYGGNRHGFLAFNEIHPDYYQIPVADRQALLEEEAAAEAELEAAADRRAEALARRNAEREGQNAEPISEVNGEDDGEAPPSEAAGEVSHIVDVEEEEHIEEVGGDGDGEEPTRTIAAAGDLSADDTLSEESQGAGESETAEADNGAAGSEDEEARDAVPASEEATPQEARHTFDFDQLDQSEGQDTNLRRAEAVPADDFGGGEDSGAREFREEAPMRPRRRPRSYKIQEVIKRRQIILVQVVKEERGNKGAALTTYLSLAGRYTVLMPNTARGGGISRKITNPQDRRRLKAIAQELEVPEGMGLIIRTAGAARTKQEIKRDFEYLLRLWESVRELTLQSTAPCLVYEEGDLIKRSIRDLYNKDVEEIVVAGEAGHREASDFMKMLMPSHAKNVILYKDPTPLFTRYGVERQLNAMFQPQVTLRSGGYIVINQTEALVAIDVNSGKSTREFSIEETALATNLEAADEIARQLKLRDLAGLIVIDFIDMEEKRNNRAVERRLKDALRFDRARIQLGRISHFGLMEMSRQRLRTGVLEGSTSQCPHCQGTGIIRSTESIALAVLRGLEDAITAGASGPLIATTTPAVALYILNSKRAYIADMEQRHGHAITILGSERVHGANFTIERGAAAAVPSRRAERAAVNMDWGFDGEEEAPAPETSEIEIISEAGGGEEEGVDREMRGEGEENGGRRGRRRRRRGRGGRDRGEARERMGSERGEADEIQASDVEPEDYGEPAEGVAGEEIPGEPMVAEESYPSQTEGGERSSRRRRRGRRGGRRGRDRGRSPAELAVEGSEGADDGEELSEGDEEQADVAHFAEPLSLQPESRGNAAKSDGEESAPMAAGSNAARTSRLWDVPSAANEQESSQAAPHAGEEISVPGTVGATEPTPSPLPSARRRHEVGSSEPRIERVVVSPGAEGGSSSTSDPQTAPQRKGWWQRKFSGE